jgi:hypothetical protein
MIRIQQLESSLDSWSQFNPDIPEFTWVSWQWCACYQPINRSSLNETEFSIKKTMFTQHQIFSVHSSNINSGEILLYTIFILITINLLQPSLLSITEFMLPFTHNIIQVCSYILKYQFAIVWFSNTSIKTTVLSSDQSITGCRKSGRMILQLSNCHNLDWSTVSLAVCLRVH